MLLYSLRSGYLVPGRDVGSVDAVSGQTNYQINSHS